MYPMSFGSSGVEISIILIPLPVKARSVAPEYFKVVASISR